MIGLVLAAGAGRRLLPLTADLPKALVPVADEGSARPAILDRTLDNLRAAGLTEVVVVVGYAAHRIVERVPDWERDLGLRISLLHNERAQEWNNAYSLWLAREAFAGGALLVNGDTLHPPVVEERLLAARDGHLLLAVDAVKALGQEEMKVQLAPDGSVRRIHKSIDPAQADGEYIGLSVIEADGAAALAAALETTWRRDPSLYYEDGYQELVDRGVRVGTAPIGALDWVEVDDAADLARARVIAALPVDGRPDHQGSAQR